MLDMISTVHTKIHGPRFSPRPGRAARRPTPNLGRKSQHQWPGTLLPHHSHAGHRSPCPTRPALGGGSRCHRTGPHEAGGPPPHKQYSTGHCDNYRFAACYARGPESTLIQLPTRLRLFLCPPSACACSPALIALPVTAVSAPLPGDWRSLAARPRPTPTPATGAPRSRLACLPQSRPATAFGLLLALENLR
jgi:hypothetical protein